MAQSFSLKLGTRTQRTMGPYLPPSPEATPSQAKLSTKNLPMRGHNKQLGTEDLGSPVGRRGAGMTSLGGGDAGAHAFSHYGKNGPPGLEGGSF